MENLKINELVNLDALLDTKNEHEIRRYTPTFTLRKLLELFDALNKTKRDEARYVVTTKRDGVLVELSYFKNEHDAHYTVRTFKKIIRLAFKERIVLAVHDLKELESIRG